MFAQQIIVAEADGPFEVFLLAGHPVNARKRLQHLAVYFLVGGRDFAVLRFDGGVLPYIIKDANHSLAPGAWPEPFGKRQQPVFDIFR